MRKKPSPDPAASAAPWRFPSVLLWRELRRGAMNGHGFHRQHPIGRHVHDFYCA
ncbi:DUF559 domain-containing protein [Enterovirga sp. CN4-39]|uniref:DUF559 domain-containing protein n=1 Tax=Enterovirga sp. CN4-39 TaxID=3400910 RepID=UPI003C0B2CED